MSFDNILKIIPNYIDDLFRLISGPRKFFTDRNLNDKNILNQSILFLLYSTIISYILKVSLIYGDSIYWKVAMITVLVSVISVILLSIIAFICCLLVGGNGTLYGHVIIFSYFSGVSSILFSLFSLISKGFIKVRMTEADYKLYQKYMENVITVTGKLDDERFTTLAQSQEVLYSVLIIFAGYVVIAAWLILIWRACSDFNAISGRRSVAALMLFLIIGYITNYGLELIQSAAGVSSFGV